MSRPRERLETLVAEVLRRAGLDRRLDFQRFVHDGVNLALQAGCLGSTFAQ